MVTIRVDEITHVRCSQCELHILHVVRHPFGSELFELRTAHTLKLTKKEKKMKRMCMDYSPEAN